MKKPIKLKLQVIKGGFENIQIGFATQVMGSKNEHVLMLPDKYKDYEEGEIAKVVISEQEVEMKNITSRKEFLELKKSLGVRDDWHEPDEQGVTVNMIAAGDFDNACCDELENHIIIMKNGEPVASVNLALLCAWASGLKD